MLLSFSENISFVVSFLGMVETREFDVDVGALPPEKAEVYKQMVNGTLGIEYGSDYERAVLYDSFDGNRNPRREVEVDNPEELEWREAVDLLTSRKVFHGP